MKETKKNYSVTPSPMKVVKENLIRSKIAFQNGILSCLKTQSLIESESTFLPSA